MIKRYERPEIAEIWSNETKLSLWQKLELTVVWTRTKLGIAPRDVAERIEEILISRPIDEGRWLELDKLLRHDLNAFLEERKRHLSPELQMWFHKHMTSFDTEEAPFATMLEESLAVVRACFARLEQALVQMANKYRYTIMYARTHGQGAKAQTHGKRCLTWLVDVRQAISALRQACLVLKFSRLSGAVGNYGGLSPELEKEALASLGFEPYYGATQIMPRILYAPIAQSLLNLVLQLNKIAMDIRLGSRSGRPIYQEPFARVQKGSSAMPHKKNTIVTEQVEGLARLAKACALALTENIVTWEERAIEQSSVERVAWPDLFHIVVRALVVMSEVLEGLRVYPDNMLLELAESRGCYASDEAKEWLKELGVNMGLLTEDECYRIIQLASFDVFAPTPEAQAIRENPPVSHEQAGQLLVLARVIYSSPYISIQEIVSQGLLRVSPELAATEEDVARWNAALQQIFTSVENQSQWDEIFQPAYLLRHEAVLFKEILGQ